MQKVGPGAKLGKIVPRSILTEKNIQDIDWLFWRKRGLWKRSALELTSSKEVIWTKNFLNYRHGLKSAILAISQKLADWLDWPCPVSNQITVVAFQPVQLAQASFLQKNPTLQNVFLISVTLRWHRASVACKNQSFQS